MHLPLPTPGPHSPSSYKLWQTLEFGNLVHNPSQKSFLMKKTNWLKQTGGAVFGLSALLAFAPNASAIVFTYEDTTSGHAIGEVFTGGGFRINLQNFDMGTTYATLGAAGSAAGFGQNGTGTQTVAGGISTLNSLAGQTAPTGAVGAEDSWGIARIITITDSVGSVIWSEPAKNAQITMMFYGLQDFYIQQEANGIQTIDGVGLQADFYIQGKNEAGYTQYNPLLGAGGRTALDAYSTVTDGTKFLTTSSVAGFIHNAGAYGGLATQFESKFNITAGGDGQTYLTVTGGTDQAQFNTNGFVSPFGTGATADLFAQFTTAPTDVANWLVRSNDPIVGTVAVPDGGSTISLLGAALALLGVCARRRNRA